MNEERDRFLTEAMGGCLCCTLEEGMEIEGMINGCDSTCVLPDNHNDCVYAEPEMEAEDCEYWQVRLIGISPNFSTWEGFGKLLTFLDGEWSDKEIAEMLYGLAITGCVQNLPDKAANYACEFLKHREEGK